MNRPIQALLIALSVACASLAAHAQDASTFPSRPIRFVIPSGAGGMLDLMGRATAESMARSLGQPVVPDNRAGAGATMTGITMASAKPDGYTIGLISCATLKLPHVTHASYDPLKDMTYLGRIAGSQLMVAVKGDAPWKSLADLVGASKRPQNRFFFGSAGSARLFAAQLADASGVNSWTNVPYKGDADAIIALLSGDVQFIVVSNTVVPFLDDGRVRVLGVFGTTRVQDHADLPTMKELGYTTVDDCPMGVVGPRNMDPAVASRLEAALRQAVGSSYLQSTASKMGIPLEFVDAQRFDRAVREGYARDQALVTKLGIPKE